MPDCVPDDLTGQIIGTYKVLGPVGAGGMGLVFRAFDTRLERHVALKFLNRYHASDSLVSEARAASALDHPNIGTIYGVEDAADGRRFIVMAWYDGQPLSHKLRYGPLSVHEAIPIAIEVAKGLAEAHAHNLIHRDIKPSNIILTNQGLVKIIDFGLARFVGNGVTQTAAISGTADYMSPEQAEGKVLDARTDLWSLGVVLYEMVTGRRPFAGESTPATLYAIVHRPPVDSGEKLSLPLREIVYRALAKKPQDRYATAAEMVRDLRGIADRSVHVTDPTAALSEVARYSRLASGSGAGNRTRWLFALPVAMVAGALSIPSVRHAAAPFWFQDGASHVAVLPFSTTGTGQEDAALGDGLMESVTSKLSNLQATNPTLWIVPASEVLRRKVTDADAARRTLGANLVVTGAVERDPRWIRLVVNLVNATKIRQLGSGEVETRNGDYSALEDAAVVKLAQMMRLKPPSDKALDAGSSFMPAAYEPYLKALGYISRYDKPGNVDQAISLLNQAVGVDPGFALAYASLGEAYRRKAALTKDTTLLNAAASNATHALQLNPSLARVHIAMGQIESALGNQDIALTEFQRSLELEPSNADAVFGLATVYEAQRRLKDAEEAYRKGAAMRPDYWEGYNHLGAFLTGRRRFEEAAAEFRRVIELTPDNAAGYSNLAAVLINENKSAEAAPLLEKAAKLAPSYAIYSNLGQMYSGQSRFEDAARATEKALQMNDKDWRPWMNAAIIYRQLQRNDRAEGAYARAVPLLEAAVKLQPRDASLQSQLAAVYAYSGNREKSISRIEAALALSPDSALDLLRIADAWAALGNRDRAVETANLAVRKGMTRGQLDADPESRRFRSDSRFNRPTR